MAGGKARQQGCKARNIEILGDAQPDHLRPARRRQHQLGLVRHPNTDDAIIAGNVAQLGGHVDRVVTAEQAGAYKPSKRIFAHAHDSLGVTPDEVVHICASPHLDHAAARDIGLRCVWIDRGTGRQILPDYRADATVSTLDKIPDLFRQAGWM